MIVVSAADCRVRCAAWRPVSGKALGPNGVVGASLASRRFRNRSQQQLSVETGPSNGNGAAHASAGSGATDSAVAVAVTAAGAVAVAVAAAAERKGHRPSRSGASGTDGGDEQPMLSDAEDGDSESDTL